MGAVVGALGTMAAIVAVGWALGRFRFLGADAEHVLARVVFAVAAPALLMVTLARADLQALLSRVALATALSTAAVAVLAVLVLRVLWRRPAGRTAVTVLASSYLNAAHLGLPLAVYLLGDALAVVPTLLFQQLLLGPLAFVVLDVSRDRRASPDTRGTGLVTVVARPLRNPILVGTLLGLALAALPWDVPTFVLEPFRLIGAAAAPLALLTFGLALAAPKPGAGRRLSRDLVLVLVLRAVVHPALAAVVGTALGLEGPALLTVVTMAALPTAQNVLVYAMQYGEAEDVARDAGVLTTLLAVPVMLVIALLLA